MGVASLPGTVIAGVTSADEVKRAAEAYNGIAAAIRRAGIQAFLHNETLENSRLDDGRLTYPVLLSYLDADLVKMQFQMSSMRIVGNPDHVLPSVPRTLYLGASARRGSRRSGATSTRQPDAREADPPAGGRSGAGRGPGAPAVALGDDSVDWPAVFAAARIGGMKNYFIEQEQPNGGWDAMVKGAAYLKTLTV